jgi:hypothetical protein
MGMGMKLAVLSPKPKDKDSEANACFIDMIQTARPGGKCGQGCVHCGAMDSERRGKQIQLSREEIQENLERRIRPVKRLRSSTRRVALETAETAENVDAIAVESEEIKGKIVASYLSPYVTTDVDVEPMDGDAFIDAAELVNGLTYGHSRMLCISHGIRSSYGIGKRYYHDLRMVFSLFGYHNDSRYSDEEWRRCFSSLGEWGLDSGSESAVYSAFVNNLKMRYSNEELDYPDSGDVSGVLMDIVTDMKFPPEVQKGLIGYCYDEELEDANLLMMGQLKLTDEFIENGMLVERCGPGGELSAKRLEKVVDLMKEGVIPGFILTVDFARHQGQINLENNLASYVKTLQLLKPALQDDCPGFVAISIQGLQGDKVPSDNPYTAERAHLFFQQVLLKADLTREERKKLQYDTGRSYAKVGKAAEDPLLSDFLSNEGECEVIPHRQFVDKVIAPQRKLNRARLKSDGAVERQFVEDGATYNSSIEGPWEPLFDAPAIREYANNRIMRSLDSEIGSVILLTSEERDRKREMEWEGDIEQEEDVFLIQPFSLLERGDDRDRAMVFVRSILGVNDIRDYKIQEGDCKRNLQFQDLKIELLKNFYPAGKDVDLLVAKSSPYIEVVQQFYERGLEVGAELSKENWYVGEMMALAEVMEDALGFDYLTDTIERIYLKRTEVERSTTQELRALGEGSDDSEREEKGQINGSALEPDFAVKLPNDIGVPPGFGILRTSSVPKKSTPIPRLLSGSKTPDSVFIVLEDSGSEGNNEFDEAPDTRPDEKNPLCKG